MTTVEVLLGLAPILLFFLPLLAGRYIGAEKLERIAARRRPAAVPRRAPRIAKWHSAELKITQGGLLLARRLAGRAPPHAQLAL
jgi:hypothetical protein